MWKRLLAVIAVPTVLSAQQGMDTITVRAEQVRGGVYVLFGAGGNIGLSTGSDAAFVVDDQFAPLSQKIIAAIGTVTPLPVKFVINTHWHGDHTGGNENFGKAGAVIVAQDNVRKRLSTDQFIDLMKRAVPASPVGALPVVTFNDSVTFHLNGDDVVAFHVAPAHTDGDVIVHFTKANVFHMGDTFITTGLPFVDLSSGGNVNGFVAAADRVLMQCDANTKIIPGHGVVSDCTTLRRWRDDIATMRERVRTAMSQGKSLDAIKAAKLLAEFDARYNPTGKGFITADTFAELVYRSLGGR
jgi:cyclase